MIRVFVIDVSYSKYNFLKLDFDIEIYIIFKGILTQSENKFTAETTSKESYKTPGVSCDLSPGRRRQKLEGKMYSSIR